MSIKFTVLLYSKYSTSSSKIISIINQYQNIFIENFNIKLLCIDNENVRKRILESKKISITFVPSILVIYNDGGVEKYENNDAFDWVNEIIQNFLVSQKQKQNNINQKSTENESLGQEIDFENIEDIKDNEDNQDNILQEEIIPLSPTPVKSAKTKVQQSKNEKSKTQSIPKNQQPNKLYSKPQLKQQSKLQSNNNKTSIEDLEDDTEDMFEYKNNHIEQVESTNALSVKKNDLLSLAAEMQKKRDTFVETTDRPKLSLNR
jgi:hypothetical protein